MNKKIWIPILVGGALGYLWYMKNKKKNTPKTQEEAIAIATKKEEEKFTPAFKMQYEVVLPQVQASRAVKEAAFAMQDERVAKELTRMASKPPVYI